VVVGTSNGVVYTQTIVSTSYSTPTGAADNGGSSSSAPTGAIVGGVVGGIAALAIISFLLWYCVRKRKRDEFDGNFDPDRVVGGSPGRDVDLDVAPYIYNPDESGVHGQGPGMPVAQQSGYDMSQRTGAPAAFVGGMAGITPSQYSHSQYSDPHGNHTSTSGSHYASTSPQQSISGMPSNDFRNVSPGPSLATTGTIPSAKEREMASDRRRLYLANDEAEGSGAAVMQHQDGGRVPLDRTPEEEQPHEIPPSYDMISPDEEPRAR